MVPDHGSDAHGARQLGNPPSLFVFILDSYDSYPGRRTSYGHASHSDDSWTTQRKDGQQMGDGEEEKHGRIMVDWRAAAALPAVIETCHQYIERHVSIHIHTAHTHPAERRQRERKRKCGDASDGAA